MRSRSARAALALAACALAGCGSGAGSSTGPGTSRSAAPGAGRAPVTVGTKSFAEQFVLGQLYKQALEARGFVVALKQNIGSSAAAGAALRRGEIDLYPEYVGAFDVALAGAARVPPSLHGALLLGRSYARRHGIALLAPTPFADGETLAVQPSFARAHRLRTLADLVAIRGLRVGAQPTFRADGLVQLERVYGIAGARFAPLTVGLQYRALDDGTIDAADVFTTDGQLQSDRYVVLRDSRGAFGAQNVVPVVRRGVLRAEGPAFARTIDAVSATLTIAAMRRLNAAVAGGQPPAEAARAFLREHGLR